MKHQIISDVSVAFFLFFQKTGNWKASVYNAEKKCWVFVLTLYYGIYLFFIHILGKMNFSLGLLFKLKPHFHHPQEVSYALLQCLIGIQFAHKVELTQTFYLHSPFHLHTHNTYTWTSSAQTSAHYQSFGNTFTFTLLCITLFSALAFPLPSLWKSLANTYFFNNF